MRRHYPFRRVARMLRIMGAVGILVGVLSVGLSLTAPHAAASGTEHWPHRWKAGGYQWVTGTGVQGTLSTEAPTVSANPAVATQSLAYVAAGSANGNNAIEVGWQVKPYLFGDTLPHLLVRYRYYWADLNDFAYCTVELNPDGISGCPWGQLSATHKPGMVLTPGVPHTYKVEFSSGLLGNIWVVSLDSELIGFLTASYAGFTQMGRAEWYGEVDALDAVSCTDMGNGIYGSSRTGSPAVITNMALITTNHSSLTASATVYATNPPWYNTGAFTGSSFKYGGPGAC